MRLPKMILAVAGATLIAAVTVATASARQLELSNTDLRATFPTWEITNPFGGVARCELTIEFRFHERRIAKVIESLIGSITRAALGPCAQGAAVIQAETLPWHIRYESYNGTLPNITSLNTRVVGMGWNITEPGTIRCLIRTTVAQPARLIFNRGAGGVLTQATWGGEINTGPECFNGRARIAGASNALTVLGRLERVTVRLI